MFWMNKATEIFLRLIAPTGLLTLGLFLLWYGVRKITDSEESSTAWGILVPAVITILLATATFALSNTKKARERWRLKVEPGNSSDRS
jgi:ABC-type arginine/histidine transport system permease subunit